MNDVAERRLRAAFRREALPAAPPTLVAALERLPDVIAARPGPRRRPVLRAALGLAAVLALGGTVAVSIGQRGPTPAPSGGPSTAASGAPTVLGITFEFAPADGEPPDAGQVAELIETVRRRMAAAGYRGVAVERADESGIVVEVPSGADPAAIRRLAGRTGRVDFIALGERPAEAGDTIHAEGRSSLFTGAAVASATAVDDPILGPALELALEPAAARILADFTAANVGSYMALTVDGRVVAAPMIQSAIPDGRVRISPGAEDGFGQDELNDLVAILVSGPLPVPLR